MRLSSDEIDEACERFESEWTQANSGVRGITAFLKANGIADRPDRQILIELIKIDCERNWMVWDETLPSMIESLSAVEIMSSFLKIPRVENYRELFREALDYTQSLTELAESEAQCRGQWGDAVGRKHYEQLPAVIAEQEIPKVRKMRCDFEDRTNNGSLTFPLRGRTVVGRQRSSDDVECCFFEGHSENRVVIANRMEAEISRTQMSIQLLNPAFALVTNLSQTNPLQLCNRLLDSSNAAVIAFPFYVSLPGRRLYFY